MVAVNPRVDRYKFAELLLAEGVDVICGGFPCQDISCAGKGAGLSGERSGLWRKMLTTIRLVRPRYIIVENVAALLHRGMGVVLGDLARSRYDTEWGCISANDVGAPHLRERIWIVGINTYSEHEQAQQEGQGQRETAVTEGSSPAVLRTPRGFATYSLRQRLQGWKLPSGSKPQFGNASLDSWWDFEPPVGRVANGIPDRSHRLKGLGNAVVPKIPEILGACVMEQVNTTKG